MRKPDHPAPSTNNNNNVNNAGFRIFTDVLSRSVISSIQNNNNNNNTTNHVPTISSRVELDESTPKLASRPISGTSMNSTEQKYLASHSHGWLGTSHENFVGGSSLGAVSLRRSMPRNENRSDWNVPDGIWDDTDEIHSAKRNNSAAYVNDAFRDDDAVVIEVRARSKVEQRNKSAECSNNSYGDADEIRPAKRNISAAKNNDGLNDAEIIEVRKVEKRKNSAGYWNNSYGDVDEIRTAPEVNLEKDDLKKSVTFLNLPREKGKISQKHQPTKSTSSMADIAFNVINYFHS